MWTVTCPNRDKITVTADYFVVDDGNLIFRIKGGNGGYPHCVRMFARGMWMDVEAKDDQPSST